MAKQILRALLLVMAAYTSETAQTIERPNIPYVSGESDAVVRCGLKPEAGPCKALFERYYYDGKEQKCKTFFGGGAKVWSPLRA